MANASSDSWRSRKSLAAAISRRGGRAPSRPAQGTGELQRRGAGGHALADDVDQDHLEALVRPRRGGRPGSRPRSRRSRRRASRSGCASPRGSGGTVPWRCSRSRRSDEHRLAQQGRQAAALPAGLQQDQRGPPPRAPPWRRSGPLIRPPSPIRVEDREGQRRRPRPRRSAPAGARTAAAASRRAATRSTGATGTSRRPGPETTKRGADQREQQRRRALRRWLPGLPERHGPHGARTRPRGAARVTGRQAGRWQTHRSGWVS